MLASDTESEKKKASEVIANNDDSGKKAALCIKSTKISVAKSAPYPDNHRVDSRWRRAKIDAESIKVTADAEAYKKKQVIAADNALTQKLETEVRIQQVWADAFSKRLVPSVVLSGSGSAGVSDNDASTLMQLLTVDTAKRLAYDRSVGAPAQ